MGWFSDALNSVGATGVSGFLDANPGIAGLADTVISNELSEYFQPEVPKIGYQGKIPELQAVRERVPMPAPVEGQAPRRPGSAGRRYFSDTIYAERPETDIPTVAEAQATAQAQAQGLAQQQAQPQPVQELAAGGIASAHKGYYLGGKTDGMADKVPATIDGTQEARLSDGEFVIPADVVSHLGNGNSDAGAEQLHGMMNGVRKARTGNPEQGKQIDPNKFMPKMAQGGIAQAYNNGGSVYKNQPKVTNYAGEDNANAVVGGEGGDTTAFDPQVAGTESSLSNWAGDYVTDMMGRGAALADTGYEAYTGPLSAGASGLQEQAFTTAGQLDAAPTNMGIASFGADQAQQYMNPYLMASLNPQLDEARRQAEIDRVAAAGRLTRAGGFGGSRQAIMESEGLRNLQTNLASITGKGYETAYDVARDQYNKEQAARNKYGFDVMAQQQGLGAVDRAIESEGMAADYAQFREERDYPYKQVQYMQSLLQGLPLEAQSQSYTAPSTAAQITSTSKILQDLYDELTTKGSSGGAASATANAGGGTTT
jgi:hypothetical protein